MSSDDLNLLLPLLPVSWTLNAGYLSLMIWMTKNGKGLKPAVYEFPKELDTEVAQLKLETMDLKIDKWTTEQEAYAKAYSEGT